MRLIGVDEAYLTGGHSYFTVESHLNYVAQSRAGDRVRVEPSCCSHDEKRLHVFTRSVRREADGAETLMATAEHMLLHVDTVGKPRRSPPMPPSSTGWPRSRRPTPGSPVRRRPVATSASLAEATPARAARRRGAPSDGGGRGLAIPRVAVIPRDRSTAFSTFSVGVRGSSATRST